MLGIAVHAYKSTGSRQILYVVHCNDGEVRHLPFGVLEAISPLGSADPIDDDSDNFEDADASAGEGDNSSYNMSGDIDDDTVNALIDEEGEWSPQHVSNAHAVQQTGDAGSASSAHGRGQRDRGTCSRGRPRVVPARPGPSVLSTTHAIYNVEGPDMRPHQIQRQIQRL